MVRHSGVHHPLALFGTQGKYNARPRIGVAKFNSTIDMQVLEGAIRDGFEAALDLG